MNNLYYNINDTDYIGDDIIAKFNNTNLANIKMNKKLLKNMDSMKNMENGSNIKSREDFNNRIDNELSVGGGKITWSNKNKSIKWSEVIHTVTGHNSLIHKINYPLNTAIKYINGDIITDHTITENGILLPSNHALYYNTNGKYNQKKYNRFHDANSKIYPELLNVFKGKYIKSKSIISNSVTLFDYPAPWAMYDARHWNNDEKILKESRGMNEKNLFGSGKIKFNMDNNIPYLACDAESKLKVDKSVRNLSKEYTIYVIRKNLNKKEYKKSFLKTQPILIPFNPVVNIEGFNTLDKVTMSELDNDINKFKSDRDELIQSKRDMKEKRMKNNRLEESYIKKYNSLRQISQDNHKNMKELYERTIKLKNIIKNSKTNKERKQGQKDLKITNEELTKVSNKGQEMREKLILYASEWKKSKLLITGLNNAEKTIGNEIEKIKKNVNVIRETRSSLEDDSDIDSDSESDDESIDDEIMEDSDSESIGSDDESIDDEIVEDSDSDDEIIESFSTNNNEFIVERFDNVNNDGSVIDKDKFIVKSLSKQGISQIIVWDRKLSIKESDIVNKAFNKFIKTGKHFLDTIILPKVPPIRNNDNFMVVNLKKMSHKMSKNMILLSTNIKSHVKFIPNNITFDTEKDNGYNTDNKIWDNVDTTSIIVRNKSGTKSWTAIINGNNEITLVPLITKSHQYR
jgi:hypothetical protein